MFTTFLSHLAVAFTLVAISWLISDIFFLLLGLFLVRFDRTQKAGLRFLNGSLLCPGKLIYKHCRRCADDGLCRCDRCAFYDRCPFSDNSEN